jgi:disulfide bond formation protein DsbB
VNAELVAAGRVWHGAGYRWGGFTLIAAAATLLIAYGFEHIGGYRPCPLCLQQRWAYLAGIPVTFAALALAPTGRARLAGLLLLAVALAFLANAGLGVYHAGVEWKLWPGPAACAATDLAPLGGGGRGVLDAISATRVIRCDEAPWSFAGLSFAGWNAVISLLLTLTSLKAAFSTAVLR